MARISARKKYMEKLHNQFDQYRKANFTDDNIFDPVHGTTTGAMVFMPQCQQLNLIVKSDMTPERISELTAPCDKPHQWLSSSHSSQALALSIFANLKYYNKLGMLSSLTDNDSNKLFPIANETECRLEYAVKYLGERSIGRTNVDAFFDGDYRIAVECKFTEEEIGHCSRTRITPKESNYQRDYCDGSYTVQRNRDLRCSLSCQGIRYWDYVPSLFEWASDIDYPKCPLHDTYQLVRNILAACVTPDGTLDAHGGHAVLLYDDRNPEFVSSGKAMNTWTETRNGLRDKSLLRKCTWQQLIDALRSDSSLLWLTDALAEKYGF